MTQQITLIAAMDRSHGIGKDNRIPWHIPAEMEHFRKTTMGHIVIMGGNTFRSFRNHPLPSRVNIVISNTIKEGNNYIVVKTPEEAMNVALHYSSLKKREIFIIGGAQIYKAFEDSYTKQMVSVIDAHYECDTFLPEIKGRWVNTEEWTYMNMKSGDHFTVKTMKRITE